LDKDEDEAAVEAVVGEEAVEAVAGVEMAAPGSRNVRETGDVTGFT
jgi:hypothetical protein